MLFCEPCRVTNGWPASGHRSLGPCGVCKRIAPCHDILFRYLTPLDGRRFAHWCTDCHAEVSGPFLHLPNNGMIIHWPGEPDGEAHQVSERVLPPQ